MMPRKQKRRRNNLPPAYRFFSDISLSHNAVPNRSVKGYSKDLLSGVNGISSLGDGYFEAGCFFW
jgi:hypothetical protein